MASLIRDAFGKERANLYELLNVTKDASPAQIRKGYYSAALKWHPDKNHGARDATLKFQALGEVHRILSDPELRAEYDATGCCPDELASETDWSSYFKKLFKPVTKERLDQFEKQYVGSSEERRDVLRAYVEGNGDIGYIVDNVMLANEDDARRFEELVVAAIESGEVERLPGLARSGKGSAQAKKRLGRQFAHFEMDVVELYSLWEGSARQLKKPQRTDALFVALVDFAWLVQAMRMASAMRGSSPGLRSQV
ncbi:Dnajc9 [Symbiodinium pilosum]|uniref:Dnajc9 protein n=1 Tax=Symbiodinium pilosum TaxID=2952 RepID=A0A812MSV2_SYMPI|nr:Dnajc9 [Symbiodinium pilosum]